MKLKTNTGCTVYIYINNNLYINYLRIHKFLNFALTSVSYGDEIFLFSNYSEDNMNDNSILTNLFGMI